MYSKPRNALVSTFLVGNAFVWYLCAFNFLQEDRGLESLGGNSLLLVIGVNFLSLAISAFLASKVINKFSQQTIFLRYWLLAGIFVSALFVVVNLADFVGIMIVAGVIGAYFGLGMPTCIGYFAATTEPQNRAKLSGLIILFIGLSFPFLSSIGTSETFLTAGTLTLWIGLGLISILTLKPPEKKLEQKNSLSYRSVLSNKTFLLYAIPWLMFSLVNELTMQLNTNYFSSSRFPSFFTGNFMLVENILAGFSAVVCGILADRKGRKRLALIGFALLGVGYASLGIFGGDYSAAWFYVCVDGIAWGAFSMLFLFTIWGDIAQGRSSEKYYVLGILPYMLSNFTRLSIGTYISANMHESTVFSFAAFFLFAAILPLAYAPETLSDKILQNLDLNNYVKKALKKVEKEEGKNQKKYSDRNPKERKLTKKEPGALSPSMLKHRN